jgi:protein-glutamine gamma-glutamyltransferase
MVPAVRLAGRLVLLALPLTVVLFLVFPRIQGGLWGRPSLINAQSGFTEEITFGSIADIALRNEVAFRVSFDTPCHPGRISIGEGSSWLNSMA